MQFPTIEELVRNRTEGKKPDEIVGYPCSVLDCLLNRYLTEQGHRGVSVFWSSVTTSETDKRIPLPLDLCQFLQFIQTEIEKAHPPENLSLIAITKEDLELLHIEYRRHRPID